MHWPGQSREKAIRPGPIALVRRSQAGDLALDPSGSLRKLDLHAGLLPQERVMLEHHRLVRELDLQLGHQRAADVVGHTGKAFVGDVRLDRFSRFIRGLLEARVGVG